MLAVRVQSTTVLYRAISIKINRYCVKTNTLVEKRLPLANLSIADVLKFSDKNTRAVYKATVEFQRRRFVGKRFNLEYLKIMIENNDLMLLLYFFLCVFVFTAYFFIFYILVLFIKFYDQCSVRRTALRSL